VRSTPSSGRSCSNKGKDADVPKTLSRLTSSVTRCGRRGRRPTSAAVALRQTCAGGTAAERRGGHHQGRLGRRDGGGAAARSDQRANSTS